jgi:hypothetical protein
MFAKGLESISAGIVNKGLAKSKEHSLKTLKSLLQSGLLQFICALIIPKAFPLFNFQTYRGNSKNSLFYVTQGKNVC